MAFQFPLDPVLRLRRNLERQSALALRRAVMALAGAREKLGELDRFLDDSLHANAISLQAGQTAAELQHAEIVREQLAEFRLHLLKDLESLETRHADAVLHHNRTLREREALESLRDSALRAYQLVRLRREQQALDESFLLQRGRRRG